MINCYHYSQHSVFDNSTTWALDHVPQTSAYTRIGRSSGWPLAGQIDEVKMAIIEACLNSLRNQTFGDEYEIILVDSSIDQTPEIVRTKFSDLKYLQRQDFSSAFCTIYSMSGIVLKVLYSTINV